MVVQFSEIGLEIRNYKSIGISAVILPSLSKFNVIVGRNNTGKSAIIDAIDIIISGKSLNKSFGHKGGTPEILFSQPVEFEHLRRLFNEYNSGGSHIGGNHWRSYGQYVTDSRLVLKIEDRRPKIHRVDIVSSRDVPDVGKMWQGIGFSNPFEELEFVRIAADRDIVPEQLSKDLSVLPNGSGLTGAVSTIFTSSIYPVEWIEDILLSDLNSIFGDDERFGGIIVQLHPEGSWEIYLRSEQKGNVPLSASGSGLKTVIHVIFSLRILPLIKSKPRHKFVYALEELENNLHPALQRRLITYITRILGADSSLSFISTHSNVIIDTMSRNTEASVLHVQRSENSAACRSVKTFVEHRGVLDDLDVRASDLLQANGVIWVEGPSDRVYINKLIDLWSKGEFKHGLHYQCVLYGGTLLKYFSGSDAEFDIDETIDLLRVNKNSALLMDSDKNSEGSRISATKRRIISEFDQMNGFAWITKGREVENYIPPSCLSEIYGTVRPLGQFEDIKEFLSDTISLAASKRFEKNKTSLAEKVVKILTIKDQSEILDVDQKMKKLVSYIKTWNGL